MNNIKSVRVLKLKRHEEHSGNAPYQSFEMLFHPSYFGKL